MQVFHSCRRLLLLAALAFISTLPTQAQNDPAYLNGQQPYLQAIKADRAWTITKGSTSTTIAVIGGGNVRSTHQDLGGKLTTAQSRTPSHLHPRTATAAAGVAAALTNNALGIAGVDWNAQLLSYDAGEANFYPTLGTTLYSLNMGVLDDDVRNAVTRGAQVILTPLAIFPNHPNVNHPYTPEATVTVNNGGVSATLDWFGIAKGLIDVIRGAETNQDRWNAIISAFKYADDMGRTVIAPVGDFEGQATAMPARLADDHVVIGVGGVNDDLTAYRFSASSPLYNIPGRTNVDVVAPITDVYTTLNGSDYNYGFITSTAVSAGLVAGVVGLMQAASPGLQQDDVRQILRRTAVNAGPQQGYDPQTGFGLVNAEAAVSYAKNRGFTRGTAYPSSSVKRWNRVQIAVHSSDTGPLVQGVYFVDMYEHNYTVTLPSGVQDPHVWIRYNNTCGWEPASPNTQHRYAEITSVSNTRITFRTWSFNVWDNLGNPLGWAPCGNGNPPVAYTVSHLPLATGPAAPTNLRQVNGEGSLPRLVWDASATPDVTYELYRAKDLGTYALLYTTPATNYTDSQITLASPSNAESAYRYKVRAVKSGLSSPYSNEVTVYAKNCTPWNCASYATATASGLDALAVAALPTVFKLEQNAPNPFSTSTEIQFDLPEASHVELVVYDLLGREVMRLVDAELGAGYHQATFNAGDLPSGVYLYRFTAGEFTETRRMVFTK